MPNPVGRPTDYKPEFCDEVVQFGKQGKSITQIACLLDVGKATVYRWEEQFPEFRDALIRAREFAQMWWEDQGQLGLTADKFQGSLWAKQVSCRFPDDYREKQDLNLGGQKNNPIVITREEDRAALEHFRMKELMKMGKDKIIDGNELVDVTERDPDRLNARPEATKEARKMPKNADESWRDE